MILKTLNQFKAYYKKNNILTINSDPKTIKGTKKVYLTAILYLSPHKISGKNLCLFASIGCINACLNIAGRGAMNFTQKARLNRSLFYIKDKQAFMLNIVNRINNFVKYAKNKNMIPVIRLNGTSDIMLERIKINYQGKTYNNIMEIFPDVQFYDYTKAPLKIKKNLPSNYDITYSYSDKATAFNESMEYLKNNKARVSVVFSGDLPKNWNGFKVVNADESDLRFLEPKNVICGLKFKGSKKTLKKAIKEGFVIKS